MNSHFRFNTFDIEAHERCIYDWVAVYDGDSLNSPLIGKFCGDVIPDVITTRSNSMLVEFITDYSVQKEGFVASYRTTFGEMYSQAAMESNRCTIFGTPSAISTSDPWLMTMLWLFYIAGFGFGLGLGFPIQPLGLGSKSGSVQCEHRDITIVAKGKTLKIWVWQCKRAITAFYRISHRISLKSCKNPVTDLDGVTGMGCFCKGFFLKMLNL